MNSKIRKKVYSLISQGANEKVVLMVLIDLLKEKSNVEKADEIMRFYDFLNEKELVHGCTDKS